MTFDPVATAGLETREVLTGTRDGSPTKIAVASRHYAAAPSDVWDALTNVERIPRWFLPIEGDPTQGGRYQFVGNAGGVVQECEPERRFAITWEMGPMVSWVEVTIAPDGDGTTLVLRHEAPFDEGFAKQYGPGAVGVGWDLGLMGLGLHLASDATVTPENSEAWTMGPDGVAFVRASATGWADAAIADGDDPDDAAAAAERTIAFYTVAPE